LFCAMVKDFFIVVSLLQVRPAHMALPTIAVHIGQFFSPNLSNIT
jgi:hypothetical protein